jgi:hypothetical protein
MPKSTFADAVNPLVDKRHYIDLKYGRFDQTSPDDLAQAFVGISKSTHLCIFFHGGLVSRAEALKTAGDLMPEYSKNGIYPFFFVWNSDIFTELEKRLKLYQHDPDFIDAANIGVSIVGRKINATLGKGGARAGLPRTLPPRGRRLDLKTLAKVSKPYDRFWSSASGLQLSVSQRDLDAFQEALLRINQARERRGKRRLFPIARVRGAGNPIARVIQRLNSKHDHDLFTTIVEELFIAIGVDKEARKKWEPMKDDIDRAFDADLYAGGTAFLEKLKDAAKRPGFRVTLIGHSAGSIYLQRFIEALDASFGPQPQQVEVITMAAAMSFERMAQGFPAFQKRVSALRVFGLRDRLEGGYWEVPFIYDKSLLYIVCSLCEGDPEADKPLLGMRRYWSGNPPYNLHAIQAITKFINDPLKRSVWSRTPKNANPGYRSKAIRHAGELGPHFGFPEEPETNGSVCHALQHGF